MSVKPEPRERGYGPIQVIEGLGPSGTGKSHTMSQLVQLCRDRRVPVRGEGRAGGPNPRHRRVLAKVLNMARSSPVLLRHMGWIRREVAAVDWRTGGPPWSVLANWLQVVALVRAADRASVPIVLEQGVFQALWSIAYRANPGADGRVALEAWWKLTRSMIGPLSFLVVLIEVDDAVLLRRLASAGRTATGRLPDGGEDDAARRANSAIRALLEAAHVDGEISGVVRIDNTKDDPSGSRVAATLREHVLPRLGTSEGHGKH